jgi:hypothetical protein
MIALMPDFYKYPQHPGIWTEDIRVLSRTSLAYIILSYSLLRHMGSYYSSHFVENPTEDWENKIISPAQGWADGKCRSRHWIWVQGTWHTSHGLWSWERRNLNLCSEKYSLQN